MRKGSTPGGGASATRKRPRHIGEQAEAGPAGASAAEGTLASSGLLCVRSGGRIKSVAKRTANGAPAPRFEAEAGSAGASAAEGTSSSSELPDGTRGCDCEGQVEAKHVCEIISKLRAEIIDKTRTIQERDQTIREKDQTILKMDQTIRERDEEIRKIDAPKLNEHLIAQRVELDKMTQINKEFAQQIAEIRTQLKTQIAEARAANKELRKMNCEELEMRQLSEKDFSDLCEKLTTAMERAKKEDDRRIQEAHDNKMRLLKKTLATEVAMHIFEEDQSYRNVDLVCPISHEIMREPVLAVDGHSYERSNLEKWFATKRLNGGQITSPVTNKEMPSDNIIPNHSLKKVIDGIINKINGNQEEVMKLARLQNREDESAIFTEIDSRVQRWLDVMQAEHTDSIGDEASKLVAEIGSLHIKLAASVQNRTTALFVSSKQ